MKNRQWTCNTKKTNVREIYVVVVFNPAGGFRHCCGRRWHVKVPLRSFFTGRQVAEPLQQSKSCLMHSINLIKQTPLAPSESAAIPHATHSAPCQDSWKIRTQNPKTMKRMILNQTWTRSMFCFFALRRVEELCSLLSVDPLIIVIQVMLKFLSKLGKGLWACKTYCFIGINQPRDSSWIPQSLLNECYSWWSERKPSPHPKVNQMHI